MINSNLKRIVFFGTSSFASDILSFLIRNSFEIVAVVTRPDKEQGRSLKLLPSPVKQYLLDSGLSIPIYQPLKASSNDFEQILKECNADLFLVVAYGEILRQNILSIPRLGCINIHTSLLPKFRGAAPIQRAIMNGELQTGVSIIDMVLEMDAGDILDNESIALGFEANCGEITLQLFEAACKCLLRVLYAKESGQSHRIKQDAAQISFAKKILSEDCHIFFNKDAFDVHNQIRALSPKPGAWCQVIVNGEVKRLKIKKTTLVCPKNNGVPGEFYSYHPKSWIIHCLSNALLIEEVQLEGRKVMSAQEFILGFPSLQICQNNL